MTDHKRMAAIALRLARRAKRERDNERKTVEQIREAVEIKNCVITDTADRYYEAKRMVGQLIEVNRELREDRDHWEAVAAGWEANVELAREHAMRHYRARKRLRSERDKWKLLAEGYDAENDRQQAEIMDLRDERDDWKRYAEWLEQQDHRRAAVSFRHIAQKKEVEAMTWRKLAREWEAAFDEATNTNGLLPSPIGIIRRALKRIKQLERD